VAMGMLLGSLSGSDRSNGDPNRDGFVIRAFYALTILAGFSNRSCALLRKLSELGYVSLPSSVTVPVEMAGKVVFFLLIGIFGVWILSVFLRNLKVFRVGRVRGKIRSRLDP